MAATAKAVAKLKLQQEQVPAPGSNGVAGGAHACNGSSSGPAAAAAVSESEPEAEAPGAVLLNPGRQRVLCRHRGRPGTEAGPAALERPQGQQPEITEQAVSLAG